MEKYEKKHQILDVSSILLGSQVHGEQLKSGSARSNGSAELDGVAARSPLRSMGFSEVSVHQNGNLMVYKMFIYQLYLIIKTCIRFMTIHDS